MKQKICIQNKSIIRNTLLLFLVSNQNFTQTSYSSAGCFFASALSSWHRKSIAKSSITSSIANATNTNAYDLADLITLGSFTWGISSLPAIKNPAAKAFLRRTVLAAPIIMILTTSKNFNKYTHILFGCSNAKCKGICQKCKITQVYKALPFELISSYDFYRLLSLAAFNPLEYLATYKAKATSVPPVPDTATPATPTNTPENTPPSSLTPAPATTSIPPSTSMGIPTTSTNRHVSPPTTTASVPIPKKTDQSTHSFNPNILPLGARILYNMLSSDARTIFEKKSQDDCYLCCTNNAFQPICNNGHATCETCFSRLWQKWEEFGHERGYAGALPVCPECREDIFTL